MVGLSSAPGVHDLVHVWVECQPELCAVRDPVNGTSITYRELWERSGRLANELTNRQIGKSDIVAVDLNRSVDLVVAFLGVIRAGAAYLPLDGHAPEDRISGILAESGTRVVVGSADDLTATRGGAQDLRIVPVPRTATAADAAGPEVRAGGDDPVYVMYTSGSTGRPKGVVVPHRAVRRLAVSPNFCTIETGERCANVSNPAFDATTFEIWNAFAAGGTVVILPRVTDLPMDDWLALVRDQEIATMFLTTSLFHAVARERPDAFGSLRNLVIGGEQLELTAVRRVLTAGSPGRLVNGYGPTETTTFAAYFDCTEESLAGLDRIPVGYPLQNTTLRVFDQDLRAVATGETGELCVGGPGVSLGYLDREELTAQRFVADPATGRRLYRTGDLARELPGGAIEVLGRRDRQIKLRGFRIELEEIESAAMATGLVDSAFVEKVGKGPTAALAGFVLPAAPGPDEDLRAALARELGERLPGYMIPARWLVLNRLPLGPTGKVDRTQLLALLDQAGDQVAEARSSVPGDDLGRLWQEVLGVPTVAATDNFLDLGGNSIMAVQLASRIQQHFSIRLEPSDVLLADSLAELAERISQGDRDQAVPTPP